MTQEESDRLFDQWGKGKPHLEKIRALMRGLVHAQIFVNTHAQRPHKVDLGYIKGPESLDLQRIYDDAKLLHPELKAAAVAELHAKHQKGKSRAEPAGDTIKKAMGKPAGEKRSEPPESVRDSIKRAYAEETGRR
jgi:hypothetical protein